MRDSSSYMPKWVKTYPTYFNYDTRCGNKLLVVVKLQGKNKVHIHITILTSLIKFRKKGMYIELTVR
ncbi:MAG: hypothetical protein RR313_11615 [Anaerovoracaceae bacterium]